MITQLVSILLLTVSLFANADTSIPEPAAGTNNPAMMNFKRAGAGTVERTLADKLADTVSARDYGVACNGVTDDTAAINSALINAAGKDIIFPAGNCKYGGGGKLSAGTVITGAGRNATNIWAILPAATLFTVSGYGAGIRHIAFKASVKQTGGSYVVLSGAESFITDFFMDGDYNGILMTGNVARIRHGRFQNGASGAIRIRAEGGDNSQMIDDVLMGAQLPEVSTAGIRVRNSSALIISNTSIIQQGIGLLIDPYSATTGPATDAGGVYSLWVHDCFLDNNKTNAIRIAPSGTASVVRSRFDSVWASSSGADGVYIANSGTGVVSGLHFLAPHLLLNHGAGLTTGGVVSDVSILGGEVAQNAQGLYFNSGLTGVHITGTTIGTGAGLSGNTHAGIVISSGVDQVIIVGNDLRGNATPMANTGGVNQYIDNNLGSASSTRVTIAGGSINNTAIGTTTPSTGVFTRLAAAEIGYTKGAGGSVTQVNSKATDVTLNKVTGKITLNNASLSTNTTVCFMLKNSTIAADDTLITNIASGATAGAYTLDVDSVTNNSARLCLHNQSPNNLSETPIINFAVIKAEMN